MSGGGGKTTQSDTTQSGQTQNTWSPHESARPGYGFLTGNMEKLMQEPVPFFPGQTYVGPSAGTRMGVNAGMHAAGKVMPHLLGISNENFGFLSNAADVANNPHVQAMNALSRKNLTENLREDILPGLTSSGAAVNALGSGRHGLAEGTAIGKTSDAIADAMTKTNLGAYDRGLGAQEFALGQTGNMVKNSLAPAQAMLQLGGVTEGYQKKALQDAMARFAYQYQEPYTRMQNLAQTLGVLQPMGTGYGSSFGQGQSTMPNPNYQSGMQQGLGMAGMVGGGILGGMYGGPMGAMAGASAGRSLGSGIGSAVG